MNCLPLLEPEYAQVSRHDAIALTPRLVLFEDHPFDEAMIRAATMWSPTLLASARALGLVYFRQCLWVPIHAEANWLYVSRLVLAPVVTWAVVPHQYELVTKKPRRTVLVDLGFVETLEV